MARIAYPRRGRIDQESHEASFASLETNMKTFEKSARRSRKTPQVFHNVPGPWICFDYHLMR